MTLSLGFFLDAENQNQGLVHARLWYYFSINITDCTSSLYEIFLFLFKDYVFFVTVYKYRKYIYEHSEQKLAWIYNAIDMVIPTKLFMNVYY
jgi:hypothetical protein